MTFLLSLLRAGKKRRELDTGCYLAELCDLYFNAHPRDTQEWPCPRWAVHTCIRTYIYAHMHMYTGVAVPEVGRAYMHTYIHICTYAYVHRSGCARGGPEASRGRPRLA